MINSKISSLLLITAASFTSSCNDDAPLSPSTTPADHSAYALRGGNAASEASATLKQPGQACACDSDCANTGPQYKGYCEQGICLLSIIGVEECPEEGTSEGCPEGTQCWNGATQAFCYLDCAASDQCDGECDEDNACVESDASSEWCDRTCASSCSHWLINSCAKLDACTKDCEGFYSNPESAQACIEEHCVALSEQITADYEAYTSCRDAHCSNIEGDEVALLSCINTHCRTVIDTCMPSVAGDQYCGPFESALTSPADCHQCGDGFCNEGYETAESCRFDCGLTEITANSCGAYYACDIRHDLGVDQSYCLNCQDQYDRMSFASIEACEAYFCVTCRASDEIVQNSGAVDACIEQNCAYALEREELSACTNEKCADAVSTCFTCGDGYCAFTENVSSCAEDCHACGDGLCTEAYETDASCPIDCSKTAPVNATCEGAIDVSAEGVFAAHNLNAGNNYVGGPGSDVFFKFTLVRNATVTLTTGPDSSIDAGNALTDTKLYLLDGSCDALNKLAEHDDIDFPNAYSRIRKALSAGSYYVVVESEFSATSPREGTFALTVDLGGAGQVIETDAGESDAGDAGEMDSEVSDAGNSDAETDPTDAAETDADASGEADASEEDGSTSDASMNDASADASSNEDGSSDSHVTPAADAEIDAGDDDSGSDDGCSAIPGQSSGSFLALLTLPLIAIRRRLRK